MNHDDPSNAMFWVGAMMVFAPITFAGVVIGVWWFQKKRREKTADGRTGGPAGG